MAKVAPVALMDLLDQGEAVGQVELVDQAGPVMVSLKDHLRIARMANHLYRK